METSKVLQGCIQAAARTSMARSAARRHFSQLQTVRPSCRLQPIHASISPSRYQQRTLSTSRPCQSEANAESKDADKPADGAQDAEKADPVAAELEAKKKEAIDLMVCCCNLQIMPLT